MAARAGRDAPGAPEADALAAGAADQRPGTGDLARAVDRRRARGLLLQQHELEARAVGGGAEQLPQALLDQLEVEAQPPGEVLAALGEVARGLVQVAAHPLGDALGLLARELAELDRLLARRLERVLEARLGALEAVAHALEHALVGAGERVLVLGRAVPLLLGAHLGFLRVGVATATVQRRP